MKIETKAKCRPNLPLLVQGANARTAQYPSTLSVLHFTSAVLSSFHGENNLLTWIIYEIAASGAYKSNGAPI